jgi:hypothetical protein
MTQDQYGQSRGTGYVVRGDAVPDDETEQAQANPMTTRLKKVASALRGDRPDGDDPNPVAGDQPVQDQPVSDQAISDQAVTGQTGTGPVVTASEEATGSDVMAPGGGAAPADEAAAVRSPDARNRDYWDEEPGQTHLEGTSAPDPSTGPDTSGTTATAGTVSAPYPGPGSQADTAAGSGSQAGTAARYPSQAGTTPDHGSPPGTAPGYGTEAGTATDYGNQAGTVTGRQGLTGPSPDATGTAEAGAAGAADAGLRPGEATERLGDFGDIAFGNLLPDAEQYAVQWQQIQFRFVDDPQGSVTEAADVISQVTAKLEAAIQERQRAIEERQRAIQERASALRGRWGEGSNADTETLRETLRMYRAFMDQLVGPMP